MCYIRSSLGFVQSLPEAPQVRDSQDVRTEPEGSRTFAGAVGWWANKLRTVVTSVVHNGGCLQDVRAVCSHAIRASAQWGVCV